ncbi:hypothetical protein [Enterococcus sp. DIV0682]|uniref:hypothetical protein n=1 Tax=Enterococcus sp. DIV0682 TaxID=2774899 RepID=UPI003F22383F
MKMSTEEINNWCTSFRVREKVRFKNLCTKFEVLYLYPEEFSFLYVNNKTKLTKKLFLRGVYLFFTLLFFFLMIAVYFYGMSILLKNELHLMMNSKDIEVFNVVVNLWVSILFMLGSICFVGLCFVVRDIKKFETEVLVMELIDQNNKNK